MQEQLFTFPSHIKKSIKQIICNHTVAKGRLCFEKASCPSLNNLNTLNTFQCAWAKIIELCSKIDLTELSDEILMPSAHEYRFLYEELRSSRP